MMSEPLGLYEVLSDEYVRLHDQPPPADSGSEAENLKGLFAAIHRLPKPRTALCISGGGIRSATFALGVIQRLARVGVLPLFDYVSTVSGGGYIGSWLSSYVRRNPNGMGGVAADLGGGAGADNPLQPEVEPLRWLRSFSNYLTPRFGLLSGDTWAFFASYLRNLILNWLMFVPLLAALLAIPRLSIAFLHLEHESTIYAAVAGLMMFIATMALAFARPVSYKTEGWLTNGKFIGTVFLPFLIASICIVLYWGTLGEHGVIPWGYAGVAITGISVVNAVIYMLRFAVAARAERLGNVREDSSKGRYVAKKFVHEVIAAAFSGLAATALLYAVVRNLFDPKTTVSLPVIDSWKSLPPDLSSAPGEMFLCFAVPLVLGILFLQAAIFVGAASWFNEEYDREWWGRAAGWVLVATVIWIVFTAIAIYGPIAIHEAPRLFTAIGGASGLFSIMAGRSGKTAAKAEGEDATAGPVSTATNIGLALLGPIFVVAILSFLSLCTSEIVFHIKYKPTITKQDLAFYSHASYEIAHSESLPQGRGNLRLRTTRFPAVERDKLSSIQHLYTLDHTSIEEGLILVVGLIAFGVIASFFIGVNQFSMHGLYRNRLIRAYLGASRWSRTPNAFSGFDPNDNLQMHRLRPEMLWANSFPTIVAFGALLKADKELSPHIEDATWSAIGNAAKASPKDKDAACLQAGDLLSDDLNDVIDSLDLDPAKKDTPRPLRNRRALEARFPGQIRPEDKHKRPMHVVNMTLNLVSGDNLAWQERKGASFAASPVNAGSWNLGYRPTRNYGGPSGLSLGTAVAISGAAASPNMGYNSSPALSFLLTLFNVRLGWWLGNPRHSTYENRNPTNSLVTFLAESLGFTNERFPYIYLSDGGHFDNLGMYEMVLRRCACIVVSDGGGDPTFGFDGLGNAIRKIRVDFGIDITVDKMLLFPRSVKDPSNPKYCAIATIHYNCVDPGAPDGKLLYIKPAFYGELEPKDVYNYAVTNPEFPHQSTGDQWFSESQFESYRRLGEFTLTEITRSKTTFPSVCDLIKEAEQYVNEKITTA
jgi:hypothetical protein